MISFRLYHFSSFISKRIPLYLATGTVPDPSDIVPDDHYYQMVFDSDGSGVIFEVEIPPEQQVCHVRVEFLCLIFASCRNVASDLCA